MPKTAWMVSSAIAILFASRIAIADGTITFHVSGVANTVYSNSVFDSTVQPGLSFSAIFRMGTSTPRLGGTVPGAFAYANYSALDLASVQFGHYVVQGDVHGTSYYNDLSGKDAPSEDYLLVRSTSWRPDGNLDVVTWFSLNQPTMNDAITSTGIPLAGAGLNDITAWSNCNFFFQMHGLTGDSQGAFYGTVTDIKTEVVPATLVPEAGGQIQMLAGLLPLAYIMRRSRRRLASMPFK